LGIGLEKGYQDNQDLGFSISLKEDFSLEKDFLLRRLGGGC
jgi:hypothetical protein